MPQLCGGLYGDCHRVQRGLTRNMQKDRDAFARDLQQEVMAGCSVETGEMFREDGFTELVVESLTTAGELEGTEVFSHRAHGLQVNGYNVSDDEQTLDLLITEYTGDVPPVSLTRTAIQTAFRRLTTFLTKALDGYYRIIEEASPIFDMALRIYELKPSLLQVRLFLLSDMVAAFEPLQDTEINGIRVSHHIWDIERLFRFYTSGRERETIEVDFRELCGGPISCLTTQDASTDYATYLSVFPAMVLVHIYRKYGNRLLERNVRSYLQARGKINTGIRQTILREPEMFLAFNNGISATAESAEIVSLDSGGFGLLSLRDFQIVNGGQTTASLYHAVTKDKADVNCVGVQVKLSVIKDPAKLDNIVPRISLYANSQNKIQTADFSANDPFHRAVENFSRTIWAPAVNGSQRQTRWYYERTRGQYQNDREKERTPAAKRQFDLIHPFAQKFTKTDLAKYENTWNMFPHIVSRGAEKNFQDFIMRLRERGGFEPDKSYFERMVAQAILFRKTEKLVHAQHYGGYRANIVTYTLSKLAHITAQRLDIGNIWATQALTPALQDIIISISREAHAHIIEAPGNGNITEWCKKEECWKRFSAKTIELTKQAADELAIAGVKEDRTPYRGTQGPDEEDMELITRIASTPGETWYAISAWAKETGNLQSWQRSLAYSLGRLLSRGQQPSRKQASQATVILQEVGRLGFSLPSDIALMTEEPIQNRDGEQV